MLFNFLFQIQMPRKVSLLIKLKQVGHNFASNLSVYGISKIARSSNSLVTLAWTMMLIFSAVLGIYITVRNINDYRKNEFITNVDIVSMTEGAESQKFVTFPAVTLCIDKFMLVGEYNKNQTIQTIGVVHDMLPMKYFIYYSNYTNEMNRSVSVLDQLEYFDIPSNDMSCVRFNGLVNERVYSFKTNLMFEIGMNNDFVLNPENSSIYNAIFLAEKRIYITDNYKKSLIESDFSSLEESYAWYEVIAENTLHIHKLGEPYNRCNKSVCATYRQINCIEECINKEIRTEHNCSIPSYFKINGLESCFERNLYFEYNEPVLDMVIDAAALKNNHTKSMNKLINQYYKGCEINCTKECFVSKWNTPKKIKFVNNNYFELKVMLSEYAPLNITEIPKMTKFDLISDIGGTLSLFIGVSFFSIVELFEFFIEVIYAIASYKLG
jgi:hypothetical protein